MSVAMGKLIQEARERAGLTQRELAKHVFCAVSSIGYYETGRPVPLNTLAKMIDVLNAPELMMQACYECPVNPYMVPWLNRVDSHPVVTKQVLLNELREAQEALENVDLNNKRSFEQLTTEDQDNLRHAIEQLMDCITGIYMKFGVLKRNYGLKVEVAGNKHYEKCLERGYLTQQSAYN